MDDDGIEIGKRIPIRVRVVVAGDEFTVDLTEVSRQVRGFYNSGPTTGYGCAQVAYKCLASPTDYPINDGSFRPLKVVLPPGRVVSAVKPAPLKLWMTIPMTIVDTIIKALTPAVPHRVAAGHFADLGVPQMHGFLAEQRRLFIVSSGPIGGGWGAKATEDGMSATVCINDGDTHNTPVEMLETKNPIVIDHFRLVEDSGGAARQRGGLGTEYRYTARTEINLNTRIERVHCAPWGLEGGKSGTGNRVELFVGGQHKKDLPNAKVLSQRILPGEGFLVRAGGGGGFGAPWERPAARVAEDVRQGYVTLEAAARDYGVMINPETFEVDEGETELRRAKMKETAPG
jgi:N-methylhydantoinase B